MIRQKIPLIHSLIRTHVRERHLWILVYGLIIILGGGIFVAYFAGWMGGSGQFMMGPPARIWIALLGGIFLLAVCMGAYIINRRMFHGEAGPLLKVGTLKDPSTGLYAQEYFHGRIEEEMCHANRHRHTLALLLCHLDLPGRMGDPEGGNMREEFLKRAGKVFRKATRGTDLAFKWGEDEIIVVLANTSREGVLIAGDRIRKGVRAMDNGLHEDMDLSIGVALYPEQGVSVDDLLNQANRALQISRKKNRRIHIGQEPYPLSEQSIKVVFQPVVNIQTGQIIGYEAFSRDPQGRLSILELFKRYQAIGQLAELKRICFGSQLKKAHEFGLKNLFINIDFATLGHLEQISKPSKMDVVLEVTESEGLGDLSNCLDTAKKWRRMGYQFAIDNFAAGSTSLAFISRLVPEYIKVDRSALLRALSSDEFTRFLRNLAPALQIYSKRGIIAVGIESDKALQMIAEIGIRLAQGYLLGRPQEFVSP